MERLGHLILKLKPVQQAGDTTESSVMPMDILFR